MEPSKNKSQYSSVDALSLIHPTIFPRPRRADKRQHIRQLSNGRLSTLVVEFFTFITSKKFRCNASSTCNESA